MLYIKQTLSELFYPPQGQIRPLDGIRACAILLVLGLHSNIAIVRDGLAASPISILPPFRGGWVGVPLFFVLSGFFIGSQIWREFQKRGSVHVGRFFFRRGMRIWPLYYFVFVVSYNFFPEQAENFWSNLLFVANYMGDAGPIRGSWSLSTEEQFYLIFPSFVFFASLTLSHLNLAVFRKFLMGFLILAPLSRAITWYSLTGFEFYDINLFMKWIYRPLHTNFDGLIVGLLISNVIADKSFRTPKILTRHFALSSSILILGLGLSYLNKVVFFYSTLALFFGSIIWMCLNQKNILTQVLSSTPLYFIAKISYGMYLVHHLILWTMQDYGWFDKTVVNPTFHLLSTYLILIVVSCFACVLTYIMVEAPFLRLRNRILKRQKKAAHPAIKKIA